jgi:hypothetical protein
MHPIKKKNSNFGRFITCDIKKSERRRIALIQTFFGCHALEV